MRLVLAGICKGLHRCCQMLSLSLSTADDPRLPSNRASTACETTDDRECLPRSLSSDGWSASGAST